MPGIKIVSLPPPPVFAFSTGDSVSKLFFVRRICPLATVRRDIGVDYRLAKIQSLKSAFFPFYFFFYLQSRHGQEAWIGPKVLPSGLPRSTLPPRVTQLLQAAQEQGEGDRLSASFTVGQTVAKDSNYELKATSPTTREYARTNDYNRLRC